MPATYSSMDTEFQGEFSALLGDDTEVVVLHSGLWTFGHQFGVDAREVPAHLLRLLLEVLGCERTIIIPSYSFSFCSTREYDLHRTLPETGVLATTALSSEHAVRTKQPVYSNIVFGPRAAELGSLVAQTAWGLGSAMAWFEKINATYLVLGVPWHRSASIIHAAEEQVRVPYRYLKTFRGRMKCEGTDCGAIAETFFVRSMQVPPDLDYGPATLAIREAESYRRSASHKIPMEAATARDIVCQARMLLDADPYVFVRNRSEVTEWVEHGKALEVAALHDDERIQPDEQARRD